MKVHEYREMMSYLTRKPLSDREVELVYNSTQQPLAASSEGQEYATGDRVGFAGGASKKILDLILETNKKLKGKKSMEKLDPRTGEVTTPKKPVTTADKIKRKPTKEEYEEYAEILDDSENTVVQGNETFEQLDALVKKQKDYEDYMYMQYKMGKLDPEPGEKTQDRLNFLRKKSEEAGMIGDRRLFTFKEMKELEDLERAFSPMGTSDPKVAEDFINFARENDPEGFKKIQKIVDDINNKNILDDFDVKNREPNATGGRVKLKGGSVLTGTGKDLEDNIKEDHKAFNDYRKSIGQGPIPLDNKYIQMWIRSRLNSGGPANKQPQKIIPLDLESVAFKLFQDKLDNLSYNQKQTVYDYIEDNRNKKAIGGRVNLANGTEEPYNPEIPSLEETDPRRILQQQIINEKDPKKINELVNLLEQYDKIQLEKQKVREEEKAAQKAKGVRYKEDFPSDAAYFAETGKQLLTNPKYTLGKIAKGVVEGTEFLGGQFGRSFLGIGKTDPSKSPLENLFYTPVLGEKLKINKLIEEGTPKDPTTGTLLGGEALEIGAGFLGPYEAYLLSKAAKKGVKDLKTKTATEADEKIDPARRDILKTGAVMGTGALLYPTAKKLDLLKLGSSIKPSVFAEAVKGTTAPSWMDSLMTKILAEGTEIKMPKESSIIKKEVKFKNPETGDVQTATLTIDPKSDRMFIEYDSPTNVANQPVVLELYRERKIVPNPGGESNWFAPDKTKGYNFYATESGPRVTDWDGNIEFDAEDTYRKIIELKSDISGLKSYATEGKGINKKVAQEKRAVTKDVEKNPEQYVPDWEPEIYD